MEIPVKELENDPFKHVHSTMQFGFGRTLEMWLQMGDQTEDEEAYKLAKFQSELLVREPDTLFHVTFKTIDNTWLEKIIYSSEKSDGSLIDVPVKDLENDHKAYIKKLIPSYYPIPDIVQQLTLDDANPEQPYDYGRN